MASSIINEFNLVFIWIVSNLVMFYYYGTKELKKELILEVYTREFLIVLWIKKKLRSSNSYTKAEKDLFLDSYTGGKQ